MIPEGIAAVKTPAAPRTMSHSFALKNRLFRLVLFAVLGGVHAASCQNPPEEATTIRLIREAGAPAISRLLLGAQYNYFAAPTRQRLQDEHFLNSLRQMPVTAMRYPGGTWADHYLWDSPERSYYAVGDAGTVITPEQFVASCRAIGAEPIFQVNTNMLDGEGSYINPGKLEDIQKGANRAARWVREANKRKDWKVKYWEIGNEVWIWLKPEEYARYVVEYSKAMKEVDPSIQIIACGLSEKVGPFNPTWLKFPDDPTWSREEVSNEPGAWNRALMDGAGGHFDCIAPHIYIEPGDEDMSAGERFAKTNAAIEFANPMPAQVEWAKKGGKKIAVSEWAANFRQSVPVLKDAKAPTKMYYYSLGNGLNTAFLFGKILEAAGTTELAILHDLDDFMTLWNWPKAELAKEGPLLHPIYHAMKIWGHHLGKTSLASQAKNCPTLKSEKGNYPVIFTYGSEDETNVYVVAINLDPESSHQVRIATELDLAGGSAEATWLKGSGLDSQNFASWNGAAPQEVALTLEAVPATEGGWLLAMPAHSMVGLTIPKKR